MAVNVKYARTWLKGTLNCHSWTWVTVWRDPWSSGGRAPQHTACPIQIVLKNHFLLTISKAILPILGVFNFLIFLFKIFLLGIVFWGKKKVFENVKNINLLRSLWFTKNEALLREQVTKFWNWNLKNTPDPQRCARFRKLQSAISLYPNVYACKFPVPVGYYMQARPT